MGRAGMIVFGVTTVVAIYSFLNGDSISNRPEISIPPATAETTVGPTVTSLSIEPEVPSRLSQGQAEALAGTSIPVTSGRIQDIAISEVRQPASVEFAALGISAAVGPVGYDAERDEMEVPRSADLVGWYEFSASPGESGSSVLAAHVDWNGRKGPFFELYRAQIGDRISVTFDDGDRQEFAVVEVGQYAKLELPTDDLFARDGDPTLALITCGGGFDATTRSYEDNIVVYAEPVAIPRSAPSPG